MDEVTTIAEQVAELKARQAERLPSPVQVAFAGQRARLDALGPVDRSSFIGSRIPDGRLIDTAGSATSIELARGGAAAVIVFYRGAWCPYCNLTLRTYQRELQPQLEQRGARLIAISPQVPDGSLTMQEKNELSFAVLSDPGNQIARALEIVAPNDVEAIAAQGELGLVVADHNSDGTSDLPMPTTVIVGVDGTIRWIDVHPNFTTRSEVVDILAAFDAA